MLIRASHVAAGSSLTFKTTLKGAGKLMNTALGDLWMPGACLIVLLITLGFGIAKLVQGQTIITTLSISVVWLIYAAIPPSSSAGTPWLGGAPPCSSGAVSCSSSPTLPPSAPSPSSGPCTHPRSVPPSPTPICFLA